MAPDYIVITAWDRLYKKLNEALNQRDTPALTALHPGLSELNRSNQKSALKRIAQEGSVDCWQALEGAEWKGHWQADGICSAAERGKLDLVKHLAPKFHPWHCAWHWRVQHTCLPLTN